MSQFKDQILKAFSLVISQITGVIPVLFNVLVFFIIAWLIIKITVYVLNKFLIKAKIDKWSDKINDKKFFGEITINIVLSKVITTAIKWMLILIFSMVGSEMFGITVLSEGLGAFFSFLPKLLTSLLIFLTGAYLGSLAKNAIFSLFKSLQMSGGNATGNILFFMIIVFTSITALEQAEIDTTIIRQNVTLIIGCILLAFSISFGLGSKDAVTRLLYGYYSRKNIGVGTKVRIDGVVGVVVDIDNICLVIANEDGKVVYPVKFIVDNKVEIIKS